MAEIDDSAAGMPLTGATAAVVILAHRRPGEPPPMAVCPRDLEPLVITMERAGAEFHCLTCGGWFGFLAPTAAVETPELTARHEAIKARFDAGERGPS